MIISLSAMKMLGEFATPADFLKFLRSRRTLLFRGDAPPDKRFRELTEKGLAEFGQGGAADNKTALEGVIDDLNNDILSAATPEGAAEMRKLIVAGTLESPAANARIVKSKDGKFAILVNTGLLILMHKFFKLMAASVRPKEVTYCNRKPAEKLTSQELFHYAIEVVEQYNQHGIITGALIKTSGSLASYHGLVQHISELFILCHEYAHFLHGDLENQNDFAALPGSDAIMVYEENKDHEQEIRADVKAYELLRYVIAKKGKSYSPDMLLGALVQLFDLWHLISPSLSRSHPEPLVRVGTLAYMFHGREVGDSLMASYDDFSKLDNVFRKQK